MLHRNPTHSAYPLSLATLSRYNHATFVRWEPHYRLGLSASPLRVDPSGVILRNRSAVRIKTRAGKSPGARLVEKFIIREKGGAAELDPPAKCAPIGLKSGGSANSGAASEKNESGAGGFRRNLGESDDPRNDHKRQSHSLDNHTPSDRPQPTHLQSTPHPRVPINSLSSPNREPDPPPKLSNFVKGANEQGECDIDAKCVEAKLVKNSSSAAVDSVIGWKQQKTLKDSALDSVPRGAQFASDQHNSTQHVTTQTKQVEDYIFVRDLDELSSIYEDYKVVNDTEAANWDDDWELIEVVMEGEKKKKKKVIVKKKGSKVKVTPLEVKPPADPATKETASPGDITRQLSKKRVSLADEDLNLIGFNVDKRVSINDQLLVEEAALLDKMISKELKEARKSSLAFPPIAEEEKNDGGGGKEEKTTSARASPKLTAPTQLERREMWKKNAMRMSGKSLGSFYKPREPTPESSSESDECDVNCHQKCMKLMPNLCGAYQKVKAETLASPKRGSSSQPQPQTQPQPQPHSSLFNSDVESDSQGDNRVSPLVAPAKTLPRFRTYTINDFQFLKVLGKGSFGKVLLAELKGSQCYYAVKCLKKDVVLEDDDVESTMIERKVLALGTGHPYFCHLFCTFQTESHLFFVMEYLNGGDLMFHIQQSGRFDEGRARFYAAEIVCALSFLHKLGIVYRDLKLDNVLLDFDGHVRIADFGMCKLQIYLDRTTDTFCGTPDYMAPEIFKGIKYNQCVDWWSFGILLYEMLVGQSPFSGCDEDHLSWSVCNERPHMPRHLSQPAVAILRDLLEKDHTKRLGSSEFGSQDVMNHRFFDGMKWYLLEKRQIDPPYKPTTRHPLDTKYFDRTFTSEKPILTPVEKTILETMDQTQFEGFSYTNPNVTE